MGHHNTLMNILVSSSLMLLVLSEDLQPTQLTCFLQRHCNLLGSSRKHSADLCTMSRNKLFSIDNIAIDVVNVTFNSMAETCLNFLLLTDISRHCRQICNGQMLLPAPRMLRFSLQSVGLCVSTITENVMH